MIPLEENFYAFVLEDPAYVRAVIQPHLLQGYISSMIQCNLCTLLQCSSQGSVAEFRGATSLTL